ncbi:hypothetical protein E2562_022255 [Oryza meyeriana var. granulata]|uniref:hAT-like transposase RNase-H fold domain-containing protein n=1 Tax=Oryza meyeriana var. granulata TaxID=110450 RepID=A0A6G1D631_9ORYZ|nr:hypothetical protein E2562_022255 [Oryza meyeriana var. granulata]
MPSEMIEKFDKYWKEIQGPMGLATILDPRFKIDYLLGFIETLTENFKILDWWKVAGTHYPTLRKVMIMKKPQAFGVVFKRSKMGLRDLPWFEGMNSCLSHLTENYFEN